MRSKDDVIGPSILWHTHYFCIAVQNVDYKSSSAIKVHTNQLTL